MDVAIRIPWGRVPWALVRVEGESMGQTLSSGDVLLLHRSGARLRPGQLLVHRRPGSESRELLVKRIDHRDERGGWWVVAEPSPRAAGRPLDSWDYGPVADELVVGRVVWRLWPRPRRLSQSRRRRERPDMGD